MLEVIRQLLILQDRDRKILQIQAELASLAPQRQRLQSKTDQAKGQYDTSRQKLMQLESDRKKSELEVEANQQLIAKYSLQQFQTKKNDEYRALAHEIETCKGKIRQLEDQQLELMEQADTAQKEMKASMQAAHDINKIVDSQNTDLTAREKNLTQQLLELQQSRDQLVVGIEPGSHARYERLLKHRGEKIVVGIEHGVCAGCHMTLPPQVLISCQTDQEMVSCPNCGRILYYSPEMNLSVPAER